MVAEEEASRLRFYVDETAYTDLHWVPSPLNLLLEQIFKNDPPL